MSGELGQILQRIRLTDYLPVLVENGFDSWDVVCDITEDDLAQLDFKLGHRRILQREIAKCRGIIQDQSLDHFDMINSQSPRNTTSPSNATSSTSATTLPQREERTKRRYRRKPRPDINAPKKPKTAYVNFADALRVDPNISSLSFVEIAREVGRQWQALEPKKKHSWECQAARAMQEYETQMDEYKTTENYRRYQNYLKAFYKDQKEGRRLSTSHAVPSVEGDHHASRDDSTESSSTGDSGPKPMSNASLREPNECHTALALALREISAHRDRLLATGVPIFDPNNLPPEAVTRQAASSLILGTGSVLYLATNKQLEGMLDHVYGPGPVDPLTLVTVLICAASGAHYEIDCMSDTMRHGMYASVALLFDMDLVRSDYIRAMRVLLLLSVYSLLEKHTAVRWTIAAGLKISRQMLPTLDAEVANKDSSDDAKRVLCTLIFMDCWLSTTLGYRSDTRSEDISNAWSPSPGCSISDAIWSQASKIGLVSREIAEQTVYNGTSFVKSEHIEFLTKKLDGWYQALPSIMRLAALTSEEQSSVLSFYQRRAILMVHMFYLGAVITLYRQLLLNASYARIQSTWDLDMPYSQIQNYRKRCSVAAQQMARIITLINFSGAMTKRCWLMIHWSFHACTVILFSAAQQLLDHELDNVAQNLSYAKVCIDMLSMCSSVEPVAYEHLGLIQPLYNSLCRYQEQAEVSARAEACPNIDNVIEPVSTAHGQYSPMDGFKYSRQSDGYVSSTQPLGWNIEMVSIAKKLSELLANPFAMGAQANVDGIKKMSDAAITYSGLW